MRKPNSRKKLGELITQGLSKRYGDSSMALQDVSLSAPSSGILALIGRNGAGKTTLVRILATELAPTSGSASINGIDVVKEDKKLRERIAIVPQEARTISWMTPKQSTLTYLMWRGFDYSEAKKRAEESLARLKLDKFADTLNRKLSGGTKRKALAAMVLASEADIIFLDEPTTGLDPISRKDFWEILRELAKDRFIFLTTHYLEEAEQLADTLAILGGGRLVGVGTVPSIRGKTRYQYSIKLSPNSPVPSVSQGEVTTGSNGQVQILTNEDEAFSISKKLSVAGERFSISPVSLDDIFFQLVGESSKAEQEAAMASGEGGWSA
jgi:ABC-2 type transport system ATP-binding protein